MKLVEKYGSEVSDYRVVQSETFKGINILLYSSGLLYSTTNSRFINTIYNFKWQSMSIVDSYLYLETADKKYKIETYDLVSWRLIENNDINLKPKRRRIILPSITNLFKKVFVNKSLGIEDNLKIIEARKKRERKLHNRRKHDNHDN